MVKSIKYVYLLVGLKKTNNIKVIITYVLLPSFDVFLIYHLFNFKESVNII